MKRTVWAAALLLGVVLGSGPAARAQAAGSLVIEKTGETLSVGTRDVPAGTTVRFRVVVDQVELAPIYAVDSGQTAEVTLSSITPGSHTAELMVVEPQGVGGTKATFTTSGKLNPVALIVVVGLVALLLFYRRRVLEPFSRRYDRSPRQEPEEDHPTT